jgi:CRISPR/Cas system Type II protein with McrA/HNH and RuvC-like nuclease domain
MQKAISKWQHIPNKQFGIKCAKPAWFERDYILKKQKNLCYYCGFKFGTLINKKEPLVWLKVQWDHIVPYSFGYNNDFDNFVAACQLCNKIKTDKIFDSPIEAIKYVNSRRREKNLPVRELWHIFSAEEKMAEILHGEVSERFFLETSCNCSNYSSQKLRERVEFLKAFGKLFNNTCTH